MNQVLVYEKLYRSEDYLPQPLSYSYTNLFHSKHYEEEIPPNELLYFK